MGCKELHKKILRPLFLMMIVLASACDKPTGEEKKVVAEDPNKELISHNKAVFDKALELGDPYSALSAAYDLLIYDSANRLEYLDTMASLYVELGLAEPALKIADMILLEDPGNEDMMDLRATGKLSLGETDEAMKLSKELYEKNKKLKYLFNIAMIHFQEQQFSELSKTLDQIEKHPALGTDSLDMLTSQPGQQQKVPSSAVLAYFRGLVAGQQNNYPKAEQYFRKAVKIYPQFEMAQRYLQAMQGAGMPQ